MTDTITVKNKYQYVGCFSKTWYTAHYMYIYSSKSDSKDRTEQNITKLGGVEINKNI